MKEDLYFGKKRGGIYVHIPFCCRKCIYCDFYSIGERKADWNAYVKALLTELERRIDELSEIEVVSLYIGGGTPSLIPGEEFICLSEGIKRLLDEKGMEISEFTIEVNPDDVRESIAKVWKEAGVNRISMGVQSLVDSELKAIGRRHDSACAINSYNILKGLFDNISLDLIFGLPGQDLNSLTQTLDRIIMLHPNHISAYSLMFEERAAITKMRDKGSIKEVSEDISVEMFRCINRKLSEAGYERYEISNYALPGFHSVHNSGYWNNIPYIGLGAGAHSYDGKNTRKWNKPDIGLYQMQSDDYCKEIVEIESLSEDELREEMLMTRLRTSKGLNLSEFLNRFGKMEYERLKRGVKRFEETGVLEIKDNYLVLTEEGVMISDEVISELF